MKLFESKMLRCVVVMPEDSSSA